MPLHLVKVNTEWLHLGNLLGRYKDTTIKILRKLEKHCICNWVYNLLGFPSGTSGKKPACQCRRCKRQGFNPWVRKVSLEEGIAMCSRILAWKIRGAYRVVQNWTQLKWLTTHGCRPAKYYLFPHHASCLLFWDNSLSRILRSGSLNLKDAMDYLSLMKHMDSSKSDY